jgi:hypothetical protein
MGGYAVADPQANLCARPHGGFRLAARVHASSGHERPGDPSDVPIVRRGARCAPHVGHPFFAPVWRADEVGMVLDAPVDWKEVAELLTESYSLLAPKALLELVNRPAD